MKFKIIFALMMVFCMSLVVATHSGSGTVTPATTSVTLGDMTTVTVNVNTVETANIIGLELTYDPNILSIDQTSGKAPDETSPNPDIILLSDLKILENPNTHLKFENVGNLRKISVGLDDGNLGALSTGPLNITQLTFTGNAIGVSALTLGIIMTGITETHDGQISVTSPLSCGDPGTSCDDNNECTTASSCDDNDQCVGTQNAPDLTSCNNGNGQCLEGACVPLSCGHFETPCDDGFACTGNDQCTAFDTCQGSTIFCINGGTCQEAAGGCVCQQRDANCNQAGINADCSNGAPQTTCGNNQQCNVDGDCVAATQNRARVRDIVQVMRATMGLDNTATCSNPGIGNILAYIGAVIQGDPKPVC